MIFQVMDFKKKVKLRIVISTILLIFGTISVSTMYYYGFDTGEFVYGFYFGLGFGLIGAGITNIIKNMMYLKNKERFKKADIQYKDERNRFIGNKIWSVSSVIMMFLIYAGVIISGIFNLIIFKTLLGVLGVFGLVLLIVKTVLNRLY